MGRASLRVRSFLRSAIPCFILLPTFVTAGFGQPSTVVPLAFADTGAESAGLDALRIDSLALVALYAATNGPEWKNAQGWLVESLQSRSWENVEIRNGRVVGLSLAGNNLSGSLPAEIGDLTALKNLSLDGNRLEGALPDDIRELRDLNALFIAGNEITDLPTLGDMKELMVVDVTRNHLTFEDIERNRKLERRIRYADQLKIGRPEHRLIRIGDAVELHIPVGGSGNVYQWLRNGKPLSHAEERHLIASAEPSDAGTYVLRVSNRYVTDLVLTSHPIVLEIADPERETTDENSGVLITDAGKRLRLVGDIQIRAEMDRESTSFDGSTLPDQDRMLARLRLGFSYALSDRISFGARIRTRSSSLPSSHIALGGELGTKDIGIDQAYAKRSWRGGEVWAGKNAFPFRLDSEVFWDRDTSPEGIAASHTIGISSRTAMTATAGYFLLQAAGNTSFFDLSRLAGTQMVLETASEFVSAALAAAYFNYSHNARVEDARLGDRNYDIAMAGARFGYHGLKHPLTLGGAYYHNFRTYGMGLYNRDGRSAWVLKAALGALGAPGSWRIEYAYSYVEKYAVASGYAQDDRVRWQTGSFARPTNFKGHEIKGYVAVSRNSALGIRAMTAEGIAPETRDATAMEKGLRFQIDWNIRF